MFQPYKERTGADLAGLCMLQLRVLTLHQLSVTCEHRKHTNPPYSWKRHLEQHECRGRLESDGLDCSPFPDTRITPTMPTINTSATEGHSEQGVVGTALARLTTFCFIRQGFVNHYHRPHGTNEPAHGARHKNICREHVSLVQSRSRHCARAPTTTKLARCFDEDHRASERASRNHDRRSRLSKRFEKMPVYARSTGALGIVSPHFICHFGAVSTSHQSSHSQF